MVEPPGSPLRALLLDLDDTLLDDRGAMAHAVQVFRRRHGLAGHLDDRSLADRWDAAGRALWRRMATGELALLEQRRIRLRQTFDLQSTPSQLDALYDEYLVLYEQAWRPLPGADVLLQRTGHLLRAIVTNGPRAQVMKKLARLGAAPPWHAVVTPDDCGSRKPDTGIFLHALRLLGVEPAHAMMLGDNEEADLAPARSLGLRTFHVRAHERGATLADIAAAL